MATDLELMENMVAPAPERELLFRDSQLETLPDTNNGQYVNGQINFDTLQLVQKYITFRDCYLQIPATISLSGTLTATNNFGTVNPPTGTWTNFAWSSSDTFSLGVPASGTAEGSAQPFGDTPASVPDPASGINGIAFRNAIMSIISGIQVTLGDNTNIVSELISPAYINQIRPYIQNDDEWLKTFGPELQMSKDTAPTYKNNSGFNNRRNYLLSQANISYYQLAGAHGVSDPAYITKIQVLLNVGLKHLHSFYDNCDFPQKGIRWLLSFNLCREFGVSNASYGFVYNNSAVVGAKYAIGAGTTVGGIGYNTCSLKYRSIDLPDEFQEHISEMSLQGLMNEKYIKYALTEIYTPNSTLGANGALSSFTVSQGLVRPVRMWYYGVAPNAFQDQTTCSTTQMQLSSFNVRVNNTNRFTATLLTQYDMWNQVTEQMECVGQSPDKGSLITYQDFFNPTGQVGSNQLLIGSNPVVPSLYSWYCIDLARLQKRTNDQAVSLIIDSTNVLGSGAPMTNFIILVEREITAKFIFDKNSAQVLVGSNV